MSCLIIKNDGIGDLILASGLISSLGRHFGGEVDLITCQANREIAEGIEPLRERFYVSRDELHFSRRLARVGLLRILAEPEDKRVLQQIAAKRYDVAICLRRFVRQSTLAVMSKVVANRKCCAWQFSTNGPRSLADRCSTNWKHFEADGAPLSELSYSQAFAESVVGVKLDGRPSLNFCTLQTPDVSPWKIALGLSGGSTNWPAGNWIELARLLDESGWQLVLTGGDNVLYLASLIRQAVPAVENRVGQLSFRDTAELFKTCQAYIGNDTGLSHFASLILRKCVIILGGGTFRRFFPWPGATNQHLIYHGMECFDCDWQCKFPERYCLSVVSPKAVLDFFTNGGSASELDLNEKNESYELSWRRNPIGKRIAIREA